MIRPFEWLQNERPRAKRKEFIMEYQTILYEVENGIALIRLNRPKSLNALNHELVGELGAVFDRIGSDDAIGAVILTGSEKAFAAGADIKEIVEIASPVAAHAFVSRIHVVFDKIERLSKPVIAAVSGFALGGGCELALVCDIRIASESAIFGLPEIKIGVIPGGGGTQRLPRLVGLGRAKELLFSGDSIDAMEAYRIGLANKVVPVDSLLNEARKTAEKLIAQPGYALRMLKMLVNDGINMDLRSALAHERRSFEVLFSTEDRMEGLQAFIEKRKPIFKGK